MQKYNNKTLLTAIIFTYNHETSIKRCIESIIKQKTKYKYIIHIWDDCSIDNTSNICREYAIKYPNLIKLVVQKENTFLKKFSEIQSFIAIKEVKTKYFCIIDGDDYWLDECKIQIALDFLEKNSEYIGFAHDTLEVNKFTNTNLSYVHECFKWKISNPVTFCAEAPFFLTSSRIFRYCGYDKCNILPIDYLLYYYHFSKGPIFYYDKIMATYVISENSTFASMGKKTRNLNSMFAYKLSLLFNFHEDEFCTNLQKIYDVRNHVGIFRYKLLCLFKIIFGIKNGWKLWFFIIFVPKYGLKCMSINYVYSHKKVKKIIDNNKI